MKRLNPYDKPGYTFSLQPPWPYEFEPQPYTPPKGLHPTVAASLKKGRDRTNKHTGRKFYTVSDFDPTPRP